MTLEQLLMRLGQKDAQLLEREIQVAQLQQQLEELTKKLAEKEAEASGRIGVAPSADAPKREEGPTVEG